MNDKTKPTKVETKDEAQVAARPVQAFAENCWALKEYRNPGHHVTVPAGTTLDDVLNSANWANLARHLRPCQTIEVHWADRSHFIPNLYVIDAGRNFADVRLVKDPYQEFGPPVERPNANRYDIAFNGPVDQFRVTRRPDNQVIQAGFPTEHAARQFLQEYQRKIAS
jgi:hypothetical protein